MLVFARGWNFLLMFPQVNEIVSRYWGSSIPERNEGKKSLDESYSNKNYGQRKKRKKKRQRKYFNEYVLLLYFLFVMAATVMYH